MSYPHHRHNASDSYITCQHCTSTLPLYTDNAAGDIICTACGVISKSRIPYDGAEWRDFNTSDDLAKGKGLDFHARAGALVDESKWMGGLEPTRLGQVFGGVYGHGTGEVREREDKIRRRLLKTDRVVEKWMEREFERKVEESRLVMQLRRKKETQEKEGGDGYSEKKDDEEEDWTALGTNEHEHIARQRDDAILSNQLSLVSEKWSLDRTLLLHGTSTEIPSKYERNPLSGQRMDLENERKTLWKKMDLSQRKASEDLYRAYTLIQTALRNLKLSEGRLNLQVMQHVCRYANIKGGLSVKGVSKLLKSNTGPQQRQINKARMAAALGSAIIYLTCKKDGLGRTLKEICLSFEWEEWNQENQKPLIKNKDLSNALKELQTYIPEFVTSATLAANASQLPSSSMSTKIKPESSSSSLSSLKTEECNAPIYNEHELTSTTNLVQHSIDKLNLPPLVVAAISQLVVNCKHLNVSVEDVKPMVLIASMTYLVCDAGGIMQRLALKALDSKEGTNSNVTKSNKRKHVRPSIMSTCKRRRTASSSATSISTKISDMMDLPFDVLSHSAIKEESSGKNMRAMKSWSKQPIWRREWKDIAAFCKVTPVTAREFYKKGLHPHRKKVLISLLESFQKNVDFHHEVFVEAKRCSDLNVLFENIVEAHPLMAATSKLQ